MKKSLLALAVLSATGFVSAQSSVTLYGVADAYVSSKSVSSVSLNATGTGYVASRQRQTGVDSGGLSNSRWGMRGSEDLGGGMKGIFQLENGFNVDTGAAASSTSLFNRQAFVGVDTGSMGTVSLGRQYGAYDSIRGSFFSAQGNSPAFDATNGVALTSGDVNALVNSYVAGVPTAASAAVLSKQAGRIGAWTGYQIRVDNSIRYATPSISGFQAAVVYGFGENKTATSNATKNASVSLSYANGPIAVALAHQDDEIASSFHLKNTGIGGSYDFGVAKAFLALNQAKYTGLAKQNEFAVGVRAPFGAATLVAQIAQSKGNDLGRNTSFGVSAEYSLSKRTTAYAAYNQTKVEIANDARNTVFGLGVRHSF